MTHTKIDMAMVEFAARAHAASAPGRITDKDTAAFRAAYILTFDEELSSRVADSLLAEYTEAHTVPTLPPLHPVPVYIDGERLLRPVKYYWHGDYVYVADEQEWYMACQGNNRLQAGFWNKQSPFEANMQYFRRVVEREMDQFIAKFPLAE